MSDEVEKRRENKKRREKYKKELEIDLLASLLAIKEGVDPKDIQDAINRRINPSIVYSIDISK